MAETVVMTLTDFLLARIAEDEAAAREEQAQRDDYVTPPGAGVAYSTFWLGAGNPARALAECDARRRIVEWCGGAAQWLLDPDRDEYDEAPIDYSGEVHMAAAVLRALALPYAEHADYDEAWRP